MNDNTETAILAARLLLGRPGAAAPSRGRHLNAGRIHRWGQRQPDLRNHPGHAEAVEIVFDPERISYRDILEFFFQIHDPTTKNRQGYDIGSSYRSEIFYTSDEQRQVAENTIADVEASGLWPGKVVTEFSEAVPFWEAEAEHQDYLQRYPVRLHLPLPAPGLEADSSRSRRLIWGVVCRVGGVVRRCRLWGWLWSGCGWRPGRRGRFSLICEGWLPQDGGSTRRGRCLISSAPVSAGAHRLSRVPVARAGRHPHLDGLWLVGQSGWRAISHSPRE